MLFNDVVLEVAFNLSVTQITKEMFKGKVATSSVVSARELLRLRKSLVAYMILAPLLGFGVEEVQKEINKRLEFIESVAK